MIVGDQTNNLVKESKEIKLKEGEQTKIKRINYIIYKNTKTISDYFSFLKKRRNNLITQVIQ